LSGASLSRHGRGSHPGRARGDGLTLDQVPGYIDALEKALAADAELAREELDQGKFE
jgi:hypothetical protein